MIVSALSDVGRARTHNEDAYSITDLASGIQHPAVGTAQTIDVQDRGVLLALSDGMGGAQAGEVASALVLASLQEALTMGGKAPLHEQLEEAVQRANREVLDAAQTSNRMGMGATVTAIIVQGQEAYIAEVGDSRAYLLRQGRLRQITRDQSLVQLMIDSGVMSPQEARSAPGKNVILQAVGLAGDIRVAIAKLALRRGDRFLICSDGVTNAVSDPELQQIMTGTDPRAACETMIALANDRGGDDNETAIVADVTGEDLPATEEFETVTETYSVLKSYDATFRGKPATAEVLEAAGAALGIRPKTPSVPPPVAPSVAVAAAGDPLAAQSVPEELPQKEPKVRSKAVTLDPVTNPPALAGPVPAASSSSLLVNPPPVPAPPDRRRLLILVAVAALVVAGVVVLAAGLV
jgi:serine/threonine protein phosphatase PrpC